MAAHISTKRLSISKDQSRIVIMVAASSAILVFSLVASRSLLGQYTHNARVIEAKTETRDQLKSNLSELEDLESSYNVFEEAPESVLGIAEQKNSKVALDALPSKYDYAALLSSIEFITTGYAINEITGIDAELESEQFSSNPVPVPIPITVAVTTTKDNVAVFLDNLHRSIRPFKIESIELDGTDEETKVTVEILTYYQPEKRLEIGTQEIK